MTDERIKKLYFDWLTGIVTHDRKNRNFNRLLETLHFREFIWSSNIPLDEDRSLDGARLRLDFATDEKIDPMVASNALQGPCSVLEMMIALCRKCELQITGEVGDEHPERIFWDMVDNMCLINMDDGRYDEVYVQTCIDNLLYRDYRPNGLGGLFTVENAEKDMRNLPIWVQMTWWINEKFV